MKHGLDGIDEGLGRVIGTSVERWSLSGSGERWCVIGRAPEEAAEAAEAEEADEPEEARGDSCFR